MFLKSCSVCVYVKMQGFDEYMNLVLDDAEEVHIKKDTRVPVGMCISLNIPILYKEEEVFLNSLRT